MDYEIKEKAANQLISWPDEFRKGFDPQVVRNSVWRFRFNAQLLGKENV